MFVFLESLAGPFSTLVGSFNSFLRSEILLRCAESDGLNFFNFTPFSLCVPVPAVKFQVFFKTFSYPCCVTCVVTMACGCKRN